MTITPAPGAYTSSDWTSFSNSAGSSIVLNVPSGVQDGDVLFAWWFNNSSGRTITPPSGWTEAFASTSRSGGLYYHQVVLASSEPSSYTWTMNGSGRLQGSMFRQAGVDSAIFDVKATAETAGGGGVVTVAAVSPTTSNGLLLTFAFANPGAGSGTPNVATFAYGNSVVNSGIYASSTTGVAGSNTNFGSKQLSASGTTGTTTVTGTTVSPGTGASTPNGFQVVLKTAVVSPTAPTVAFTASSTDRVLSVDGTTSAFHTPATALTGYDWDWGDGTTHGSGSTATHTYAADGTFTVTLTVTDNNSTPLTGTVSHAETVANRTQAVEWGNGTSKQPAWLWWGDGTAKQKVHAVHIVGSGAASVSALLAKTGFVVGHMGDSGDTAQGSMQSITDGLVRGNIGIDAAMLSVQVTSDGIYFPLNDIAYLDGEVLGNAAGTTLDPRTMTWATIKATYQIGPYYLSGAPSTPKYTFVNMDDIRKAYPNLVIFIDPKTIPSAGYPALLSWMAANGGTTKFVAKGYYNMSSWFSAARTAGYKTWGYMYEADYTADTTRLSTYGPALDILGMEYGATSPTWSTFTHYAPVSGPNSGVTLPCMGFIAPNLTAYNTCMAAGAKGVMVSGVKSVLGT